MEKSLKNTDDFWLANSGQRYTAGGGGQNNQLISLSSFQMELIDITFTRFT